MSTKLHLFRILVFLLYIAIAHSCINTNGKAVIPKTTSLRAFAYPLILIDPYTSAWSKSDQLFDSPVRHWTGLIGVLRVDGKVYRFLGKEDNPLYQKIFIRTAVQNSKRCSFVSNHIIIKEKHVSL